MKLVNPRITAEGYKIGTRGFANYVMHADDIVEKEERFGVLKFAALRREVKIVDGEGNVTERSRNVHMTLNRKDRGL